MDCVFCKRERKRKGKGEGAGIQGMGPMRRGRVCHLTHQQVSCIRMKLFRINHYPLLHQFQPSPARPLSDDVFVCEYTYVMRVEKPIEVCCCCCHYDPTSHQSQSFLSFSLPYICPSTCHIATATSLTIATANFLPNGLHYPPLLYIYINVHTIG